MVNWWWGYTGPVKNGITVIAKQLYTFRQWYIMHHLHILPYMKKRTAVLLAATTSCFAIAIHILLHIFGLTRLEFPQCLYNSPFTVFYFIIIFLIVRLLKK